MPRSEDHILSLLDACFDPAPPSLTLGRGDDCAEFAASGLLALSTDLFLEDVHFRRSYFLPEEIGHKALAVNLSDLAAAGAAPLAFSLGFICPPDLPAPEEDWLLALFRGMASLAEKYTLVLSGGDTSAGEKLGFCVTLWGAAPEGHTFALRRGARPGQDLFVIGPGSGGCTLGLARLGLTQLEARGRTALEDFPRASAALLTPWPQVEAGRALASQASHAEALFLMDVSDGLLRDLPRLLRGHSKGASFPGADLDFSLEILHPELRAFAGNSADPQKTLLEYALAGGDDYLLLGAAEEAFLPQIHAALKNLPGGPALFRLGRVEETPGLRRQGRPLEERIQTRAFDHFAIPPCL